MGYEHLGPRMPGYSGGPHEPVEVTLEKVRRVVDALGGPERAEAMLGVPVTLQLWENGRIINTQKALRLIQRVWQLVPIVEQAQQMWVDPKVARDWLTGSNAYLGGSTPLSVALHRENGVEEVLQAIEEYQSGAYA